MRRLGDSVSMQAPSLYKHFPSKAALTSAIIDSALFDIGGVLHDAVRRAGPGESVASLLSAYRDEALGHPDPYRLVTSGFLDRDRLSPRLEEWAGEPFFLATATLRTPRRSGRSLTEWSSSASTTAFLQPPIWIARGRPE